MRTLALLLWRNLIRRKRAKCASCIELFSPVFVVVCFVLIYLAFSNENKPAQQYLDDTADVYPLAGFAYRLQLYNAELGLGECSELPFSGPLVLCSLATASPSSCQ
jgi:hypothetical protein